MKSITIKQPFAQLVVNGIKNIENRSWNTKFRGRVLIHTSQKEANLQKYLTSEVMRHYIAEIDKPYINGAIIGSVDIINCVRSIDNPNTTWGSLYCYHWILANPLKFPEPIPAKGKLSFWEYPNILAEPEEERGESFCHCQISVSEENQVRPMFDHYECRYCGGRWYK